MRSNNKLKMYTVRHFLFYMGVTCAVGCVLAIALNVLAWSNGLNFVAAAVTGLAISAFAMREGLFGSPRPADLRPRHSRHA
jgi:hypothetical protein